MINTTKLHLYDIIKVEYATGRRMKGCTITGVITKIWTPEQHSGGVYQWQVDNGWCFHQDDILLEHYPAKRVQPPDDWNDTVVKRCDHDCGNNTMIPSGCHVEQCAAVTPEAPHGEREG